MNSYTNYETNKQIIDMEKYNGRVSLMNPEDSDAKFRMYERIAVKNKATEFRDPLQGIWENNILSDVFFSAANEQIIQNGIRAGVYNLSEEKYVVAQQSSDNLKIVMRSTYLTYALHKNDDITGQVEVLNKIVLEYCVPFVFNEAVFM
jgi:hypothetical protein